MKDAYNRSYGPSTRINIKKWLWILLILIIIMVMVIPSIIVVLGSSGFAHLSWFPASKQYQFSPGSSDNQMHSSQSHLEIGWIAGNGTASQNLADYKNLNIVSPELASIDSQHALQVNSNPSLVSNIHALGKKVWARVTMQNDTKPTVHSFLANQSQTKNVIHNLVQTASTNHWDGINLDIENVEIQDRDAFSAFVKDLANSLKKSSTILSIDLLPDSGGNNSKSPFDHNVIGTYCNYIFFMGYDQHWSTDPVPGPITSLYWLKENVQEYIQTGIPPEKLILGLPAYTRVWEENQQNHIVNNPAEPISYIENLVAQNHRKLTWDSSLGEYYTSYKVNNLEYKIWLPTAKSFGLYLDLVSQYHLAGSAVWNLDQMNSTYWNQIF